MMQKKLLLVILASILPVLSLYAGDGDIFRAKNEEGIELTYKVISEADKTCQVGNGSNMACYNAQYTSKEVTIPSKVNGYSVTSIGNSAFSQCYNLPTVNIPNSVTSIGDDAFYHCEKLVSITIPSSVTSIGSYAFTACKSLTSVIISDNLTSISNYTFNGCSSLASITIPSSVTSIGKSAFNGCSSLASITIPSSVTSIGESAFYKCGSLASITIPSSVTSIGESAFRECSSLASITIPNSVTSMGGRVFQNCGGLTSVTMGNGLNSIGEYTFSGCNSLTSITFGNNVSSIGVGAFYNCSNLTTLTIPYQVSNIGNQAFYGCSNLKNIIYQEGATAMGDIKFSLSSLTTITLPKGVTSIGDISLSGCNNLKSITIPEGVTSVGYLYFYNCSKLTNISFPNSLVSFGGANFRNCSQLTDFVLPEDAIFIKDGNYHSDHFNFEGCKALTSVTIPKGVYDIFFKGCSNLTSAKLPEGIICIFSGTFQDCSKLTDIYIPSTLRYFEGDSIFEGCNSLKAVHITDMAAWCESEFWVEESNPLYYAKHLYLNGEKVEHLVIPEGVEQIPSSPFWGCVDLISIKFPASIKEIRPYGLYGCKNLSIIDVADIDSWCENITLFWRIDHKIKLYHNGKEVKDLVIPEGIISLSGKFNNISNITSVTIPPSVEYIGFSCFEGWDQLTSVYISDIASWCNIEFSGYDHDNPLSLAKHLYVNNKEVKDLVIPEGVTNISNYAFYGFTGITSVSFPNSVSDIGQSSFDGCVGVESIKIPSSVTGIGERAFWNCHLKEVISLIETPFDIDYSAFRLHGSFSYNHAKLYVPIGTKEKYKAAEGWKEFPEIEEIDFPIVDIDEASKIAPVAANGAYVTVNRTINADEWSTICLPFAMTEAQVKSAFGSDVELGDFAGCDVKGDHITVKFDKVTAIDANHPYIIKVSSPVSTFIVNGVNVTPATAEVKKDGNNGKYNSFIGNYENGKTLDDGILFLYGNNFCLSKGSTKMKALRGYFKFDAAEINNASRLVMQYDEATDVREMEKLREGGTEIVYDLQGRRVNSSIIDSQSSLRKKGVYVKNGKKIIVK